MLTQTANAERCRTTARTRVWRAENVAAYWTAVVVAAMVLRFPDIRSMQFFSEAAAYLLLLLWLTQAAPLRPMIERAGSRPRLLAAGLVGMLLLGQLAGLSWGLFPLVRWDMYTRAEGSSQFSYLQYEAEYADGSRAPFNPAHAATSLNENRLVTKFSNLYQEALAEKTLAPGEGSRFEQLLLALGDLANERRKEKIVALTVQACSFDLDRGPSEWGPNSREVATYRLPTSLIAEARP